MPDAFKNLINADTVGQIGTQLKRVWPRFDRRRFQTLALDGLDALEFKARAQHLCRALEATLPADFDAAADLIEASLAPTLPGDSLAGLRSGPSGLAGWAVWPLAEYVARRGLASPERALATLHALTQRHTAEWALRTYIEAHPTLTFATLARWSGDDSPHVRRLVSEGSRPRLPWGLQLKGLIADPRPTLPLLAALQDDPSDYVRRSVANHLNDIAKDHPALVVDWVARHLGDAPPPRVSLLRHASRTLVKQGHAGMLAAWGLGQALKGRGELAVTPAAIRLGDGVQLDVVLRSTAARAQKLVVDYAVLHVKANGTTSAKVFKGWVLELAPRETRVLRKHHPVKPITTRRYHAGWHPVELRVNGATVAQAGFELRLD